VERDVGLLSGPETMQKDSQLPSYSDHGLTLGLFAASGCEVQAPLSQCRVSSMWPQDMVSALDQQTSKIGVASLGDAKLRIAFARLAAFWSESKIATDVPTATESALIPERQHEGKRGDMTDAVGWSAEAASQHTQSKSSAGSPGRTA